jgi:hypothetical protein
MIGMTFDHKTAVDTSKVHSLQFDGIDHHDYPDYCDAYISAGEIETETGDRELTEDELDELNSSNNSQWKYEQVWESLI